MGMPLALNKIYSPFLKLFRSKNFSIFNATTKWLENQKLSFTSQESIGSTNDLAKTEAFQNLDELKVYVCDEQTQGRGRGTHSWSNPPKGASLMTTFSFQVGGAPQSVTAPLIGLAVYETLQTIFPFADWSIKAPNDIYGRNKKVCGLLVETVQKGIDHRLIIGIGLNIFGKPTGLSSAGYLTEFVPVDLGNWNVFMTELQKALRHAVRTCTAPNLTLDQRNKLLSALNKNPLLPVPYKMVSPFGDLMTENETVSWRDL